MPLIITLKCVAYTVCILISILHSTVANTKVPESEVLDVILYNNIFVESDKIFEFSFNSTSEVEACTSVTPYNAHLSINCEFNPTCYEESSIFISLEDPHSCILSIQMANESDSWEWRCVYQLREQKDTSSIKVEAMMCQFVIKTLTILYMQLYWSYFFNQLASLLYTLCVV